MAAMFSAAAALSIATWLLGMRTGVRALQEMDQDPFVASACHGTGHGGTELLMLQRPCELCFEADGRLRK